MHFTHYGFQRIQKDIVEYYHILGVPLIYSPSIWQSYINAILGCLQSRKHCKAIMDDLLLFTPSKKAHMAKLEDLLKALLKNGLKISPKKVSVIENRVAIHGECHIYKR